MNFSSLNLLDVVHGSDSSLSVGLLAGLVTFSSITRRCTLLGVLGHERVQDPSHQRTCVAPPCIKLWGCDHVDYII
jgi:hypothetical protein